MFSAIFSLCLSSSFTQCWCFALLYKHKKFSLFCALLQQVQSFCAIFHSSWLGGAQRYYGTQNQLPVRDGRVVVLASATTLEVVGTDRRERQDTVRRQSQPVYLYLCSRLYGPVPFAAGSGSERNSTTTSSIYRESSRNRFVCEATRTTVTASLVRANTGSTAGCAATAAFEIDCLCPVAATVAACVVALPIYCFF